MTPPKVFGQIYLGDDIDWTLIRYDVMDTLYIGPFGVMKDGNLGLVADPGNPPVPQEQLWRSFRRVVIEARQQKPNIKIVPMQMPYPGSSFDLLTTPDLIEKYTDSVAAFIARSENVTYYVDPTITVSLRVDGFNIDYEGDAIVLQSAPTILGKIRAKLDSLDRSPRYEVSITPDTATYLNDMGPILDYVNMQAYDGGAGTSANYYLQNIKGLKPSQIAIGISSEGTSSKASPTIHQAVSKVKAQSLGGIWAWRLNSTNWVFENMCQVLMYNKINSIPSPDNLEQCVDKGWDSAGLTDSDPPVPAPGYTQAEWIKHDGYRNPLTTLDRPSD